MSKKRFVKISKWFLGILFSIFLLISGVIYLFKDDIIQVVVTEINGNLKSRVDVGKVDLTFWSTFPNVSVGL